MGLSFVGCGETSSESNETAGTYRVKVVRAEFPTSQRLGETTLLTIGVRNAGRKTIPALTVTTSVAGKAGEDSTLPFGIRDPQPGLAQPDRPVWVLSARYPRLAGSSTPAGAETAARKTFAFGPLKPGRLIEAVWKLNAVKSGKFTLLYKIGAGLSGAGKATTAAGVEPGGSFSVHISTAPPNTIVTDNGEVVTIPSKPRRGPR
ncbi:MAG: hypothetical protein WBM00_04180 [Solirubrobacterales bacterium]